MDYHHNRPEHINPTHWQEWLNSGVHPDLITKNVKSLSVEYTAWGEVCEDNPHDYLLYGFPDTDRRNDGRLRDSKLKQYQHIEHGGWWCSGVNLLSPNCDELSLWGCLKPNEPRTTKEGKLIKYEHPPQVETELFALSVPRWLWEKISERFNVPIGDYIYFWEWIIAHPQIPILITEGAKKAGVLLTSNYVVIALPGVWNGIRQPRNEYGEKIGERYLIPQLQILATGGREFIIVFDHDTKPKTIQSVNAAIKTTAELLLQKDCQVSLIKWAYPEKGVDDLIMTHGVELFHQLYESRCPFDKWLSSQEIKSNEPDSQAYQEYINWEAEQQELEEFLRKESLIKRFSDLIKKQLKISKPSGFGVKNTPQKPQRSIIDYDPSKGLPTPEKYLAMGEPIIEFPDSIPHALLELEAINKGYHALNTSFMGSGKSHGVTQLGGKIIYCSSEHRNPSIETIRDNFTDLNPRNKYGFYYTDDGKKYLANSFTPLEDRQQEAFCHHALQFHRLSELGYHPNEKDNEGINPICASCKLFKAKTQKDQKTQSICDATPGFYRHDRRETFTHSLIRCSLQSLSRDETYPDSYLVIEEAVKELTAVKKLETNLNHLIIEVDRAKDLIEQAPINEPLKTEFIDYINKLLKSFKQLFSQKQPKWGIVHQDILKILPTHQSLESIIELLDDRMVDVKSLIAEPDSVSVSRSVYKQHRYGVQITNSQFKKEAYQKTQKNFDNLIPNGLVNILKAIAGEKITLRRNQKTLSLTLDDRWYNTIFDTAKGVIFKDATATLDTIKKKAGTTKPIIQIRRKIREPLANLTIEQIKIEGIKSNEWSETAQRRVSATLAALRDEYGQPFPIIMPKRYAEKLDADGWWFNHSRGTNDFEREEIMGWVGCPNPNLGDIEDELLTLTGSLNEFDNYYKELVESELLQGIGGRQRVHRYPDKQFFAVVITSPDTDLSFLSKYGALITIRSGCEITPEAGTPKQMAIHQIVDGILEGAASTQTEVASYLGLTQQCISKHLRSLNVTLGELIDHLNRLTKTYTTRPINKLHRDGCITGQLYKDPWWRRLLDLPPLKLIKPVVEAIYDLGWHDFRNEFLDPLPESLQIKVLSVLTSILLAEEGLLKINFDTQ